MIRALLTMCFAVFIMTAPAVASELPTDQAPTAQLSPPSEVRLALPPALRPTFLAVKRDRSAEQRFLRAKRLFMVARVVGYVGGLLILPMPLTIQGGSDVVPMVLPIVAVIGGILGHFAMRDTARAANIGKKTPVPPFWGEVSLGLCIGTMIGLGVLAAGPLFPDYRHVEWSIPAFASLLFLAMGYVASEIKQHQNVRKYHGRTRKKTQTKLRVKVLPTAIVGQF